MKIQSLFIYPVKSCRGINVPVIQILNAGPAGDREWMLVDNKGKFLTQRTTGKMAQIETALDEGHLTLAFEGRFFKISRKVSSIRPRTVKIWSDSLEAHDEPVLYSQAVSEFLGMECHLVKYTANSKRVVTSKNEDYPAETRFTDRKPLLIINTKSVEDLNSRIANPIGADRFRPNVVYQGQVAFEEEEWKRIQIGSVIFSQPRKCGRCPVINLDSKTGEGCGTEPLKILSTYRRDGLNKVNFGTLWTPENNGVFRVIDSVQILD